MDDLMANSHPISAVMTYPDIHEHSTMIPRDEISDNV
jgi:hypothetical protein